MAFDSYYRKVYLERSAITQDEKKDVVYDVLAEARLHESAKGKRN